MGVSRSLLEVGSVSGVHSVSFLFLSNFCGAEWGDPQGFPLGGGSLLGQAE